MADKFEDLRNYVAVIDSGGVNAAAAALGIAKSAVSRRLSELEQRLGVDLVNRSARSFEPTAVGRRYYERARELLDGLAALDAEAISAPGSPGAPLTVVAGASLAPVTAAALAELARTGAAVIEIADVAILPDGSAPDVFIGAAPLDADDYERRAGPAAGMSVVASPTWLAEVGRPKSFADLRALPGVAVSTRPDGGWRFGDEGVHSPTVRLSVHDDASALAAAVAGAGVARVPTHLAAEAITAGKLEQVLRAREPAPARLEIWIRKDAGGAARGLADHLAAALPHG